MLLPPALLQESCQCNPPADLSEDDFAAVDVLLACGTGPQAGARANLQELWPRLTGLRWLHSVFAGLEHLMFPELADSDIVMTNAKVTGVPAWERPHCINETLCDDAALAWSPFMHASLR